MFLSSEQMWDLPINAKDGEKHVTHWAGNILYVVFLVLLKVLFRLRVDGREKLRAFQGQGLVCVSNHTSFLDVVCIWVAARRPQWVRFMARDTLFGNAGGLLGQCISRVGAFPVSRDTADRTSIKRAARMLKDGEIVGIMPEGTRRGKSDRMPEIHAGAGFIAKMGKAPIMPLTVRNAELVKQKGKFVRFPKISVEFGDPVLLEDFEFVDKKERLDAYTWYCMRECFALNQRVSREEVDMVALFPTGKDYTALFAEHPIPVHDAIELGEARRKEAQAKLAAASDKE